LMDYFEGLNLEEFIEQRDAALSETELLALALPLADALRMLHAKYQVFHRDLKPANLLVRKEGEQWQFKLIDFGLARQFALQLGNLAHITQTMSWQGTHDYAAPEQMGKFDGRIGPYTDIYGFGRLCFYALFRDPKPFFQGQKISPELAQLLQSCIQYQPKDRV